MFRVAIQCHPWAGVEWCLEHRVKCSQNASFGPWYFSVAAILTLFHGRVTSQSAFLNEVEGVAVLNLSNRLVSHFFDCKTSEGSGHDLVWSKEGGIQRFSASAIMNRLRIDLSPLIMQQLSSKDAGVYICTNIAQTPPQSVSINIIIGQFNP